MFTRPDLNHRVPQPAVQPRRRLLAAALAALAALAAASVAGCGGGGNDGSDSGRATADGVAGGAATAPAPGAAAGCADIGGRWAATETARYACNGEPAETVQQTLPMVFEQSGCSIRYTLMGVPREGSIIGRSIVASGDFALAQPGATLSENRFNFTGSVAEDGLTATMAGSGRATGSLDGATETCSATTEARLTRCKAVAVAVMRGGRTIPGTQNSLPQEVSLNRIGADLEAIDSRRIVHRVFDSNLLVAEQGQAVRDWLAGLNEGCGEKPALMLVGHSLGGYVALNLNAGKVCSRVTFDPIDPTVIAAGRVDGFDQHTMQQHARADAPVIHFVAEKILIFWGYQVAGQNVTRRISAGSDHSNIPTKVYESPADMALIVNAARDCLAKSGS